MYEIGRLCVKIAGRDARLKCVIVELLENSYVIIDGQTRRKKCNVKHLEPLDKVLKIKKSASHAEVVSVFKKEGIDIVDKKPKAKSTKPQKLPKDKSSTSKVKSAKVDKKPKKVDKKSAKIEVKKVEEEPKVNI